MPVLLPEFAMEHAAVPVEMPPEYGFTVTHQKVELDIDFRTQSAVGRSELTIAPQTKDLKTIRIDARQCEILEDTVTVNGRKASFDYNDPYEKLTIPNYVKWTADQFDMQKEKTKGLMYNSAASGELVITIPKSVHIEELDPFADGAGNALLHRAVGNSLSRAGSFSVNAGNISTPVTATPKVADDQAGRFTPITISIPFRVKRFREGLRFVGLDEGDLRYPHAYTMHPVQSKMSCCVFPCVDDPTMHCSWELSIKCSRTLGNALQAPPHAHGLVNGVKKDKDRQIPPRTHASRPSAVEIELSEEDKNLEMVVVCSGDLMDEAIDPVDSSKKTATFFVENQVAAQHIGFAIGPFEHVDLSEFREEDEDEKLGQKAVQVHGYCLPGRLNEIRNTCEAMAHAIDYFTLTFGSYPFSDYSMAFVDDQIPDTVPLASICLCSTRLLIPEDIIDPEVEVTRTLTHALASQWIGVNITPSARCDTWAVVGIAYFITDLFMKNLCGNNEYRFRQKVLTDKLVKLDIQRPSIYALGEILHLGSFESDFMALKAPLVLFILDRRLIKASGSTGLARVIGKLFFAANTGGSAERLISTEGFRRLCEKVGHYKLDSFWNQWITGAGCPRFTVNHRFNKKRLTVEMHIAQKQETIPLPKRLYKDGFMKEFKEETAGVYAGELQPVFTGPMTIRIHEADGTPYEHIVEIREGSQRIEIPYNTKYKRLKRSRRQRERAIAGIGADISADNQDDVLLYCLGDVLQSPEEIKEWGLQDWDAENEQRMDQESYEWIRMDADFEWLCELTFSNMPSYMYVSQLQQDRDVVAQQDSMLYLKKAQSHPLVSTFLVRTLMDRRYFHGIRTMAAECLPKHATEQCAWIGRIHLEKAFQEFYCYPGSLMPQTNDFRDKTAYFIKCAVPKAMAEIRSTDGKCPLEARQFILDQLRFNDNGNNDFSDCFYIATLMNALTDSLIPRKKESGEMAFTFDDDEDAEEELQNFQKAAVGELERYRRMDEWILSYQNIYTITALNCFRRLMKANVIRPNPLEFVQYVHDGTLDVVRTTAFDGLVDLGYLANDLVLELLLNVLSTDPSPFVRKRLFQIFGEGLAVIAFGENKSTLPAAPVSDGLIVQQETEQELEARRAQIARSATIEGALVALKEELHDHEPLKAALWAAVQSPLVGAREQQDLLEICWMLYEARESMVIAIPLPRYWKVSYLGKGILKFAKTKKIRTKKIQPLQLKAPAPAPAIATSSAPPVIRISHPTTKPPKRPLPVDKKEVQTSQPPRKIVRLHFSDFSKVAKIGQPQIASLPTPVQHTNSLSRVSPATIARAAGTPSSASATPARKPLPDFASMSSSSTPAPPARKPLPDSLTSSSGRKLLPDSASPPAPSAAALPKKPTLKLKFNLPKKA